MGATIKAGGWSYTLTESDKLWAARMCQYEGGNAADVLWTMTQAYAQAGIHRRYPTFAEFIQSYSQPINPKWRRDGLFCRAGGRYAGQDNCSERRLATRDTAASLPWSGVRASIKSAVSAWFDGTLPNPVPKAVEFADSSVSQSFIDRTPGSVVVKRAGNWYIATPSSLRWSDSFVKMAGSAIMPILAILLGLGFGAGAAFLGKRAGFDLFSLGAFGEGLRSSAYADWENDYPGVLVTLPGLTDSTGRRYGKFVEEEFPGVETEWLSSSSALEIRPKHVHSRSYTKGDFAYWARREPGFASFLRQLV
jgi:hypothetical protein